MSQITIGGDLAFLFGGRGVEMKILKIMFVMIFGLGICAAAQASTVTFYGGHTYKVIYYTGNWISAKNDAEGLSFAGTTGYLATVTSEGENAAITDLLVANYDTTEYRGWWLGGSDNVSEGTWKWETGPETGNIFWLGDKTGYAPAGAYENWSKDGTTYDEPINPGGDYLQIVRSPNQVFVPGQWRARGDSAVGYIVEFDAVPIPGAVWLLGSGLIALIGLRKKFKK
jgi:hypothetical protein